MQHRRAAEARRGSRTARGYGVRHRRVFREGVLARDPICTLCRVALSTDADHYPRSLRELQAAGIDGTDPIHGRGLCKSCHSRETARLQPGGFMDR
jgi:5-methylcytosine-specific restriction protein A